ncbi:MAG TPA: peptide ABC transporter ATP-binding protein, partial [Halomonas sp.]|nr:peptide ABC transporter ATP-binding protein [Halomonas sp.]
SRDCDDELVAAWGSALDQLRRSGELQRIWQQYEAPTKRQD